jgi:hypothetical protein
VTWLLQLYKDFALGTAVIFWVWVLLQVVGAFVTEPRQAAAKACGVLAWVFAMLAILWAAHLSDKYL